MALNLNDRMVVLASAQMQTRCQAAIAEVALYHLNNQNATDGQLAWARNAIRNVKSMSDQVSPYILNDANFLNDGSSITDALLKGAMETNINNHFIVEPEEPESGA